MATRFFKGLLLGSLIGGPLGLLLTPKSGKQTQKDLKAQLDDGQKTVTDLEDSLLQFQKSLQHLRKTSEAVLPDVVKETKKTITAFQFQVTPRIEEIKKQAEKIQQELPKRTS